MRAGVITIFVILLILFIIFFSLQIYVANSALDIHLHDTYFVIDFWTIAFWITLFLLFAFSLAVSISSKFKNKIFKWVLFLSGAGILSIAIYLYSSFSRPN
jgi:hypothetical protein